MNKVNPKALLHSKWSKVEVTHKEKHFIITKVKFDEDQKVVDCVIEAVMTKNDYEIDWRELKLIDKWRIGWQ
ncbi:TIGR02450 family Trp-rich protein [Colwellia sp. 12G3]|uniref:TIGR02450 family Trp-rich protein n=1 Tax=Colwellia sp. 12G3 TaxID=2058299 RepID=UPI000C347ACE|nr:TIGR02450 family Trp-rich protein [Colwellia sp. 12G3]PKI17337.1 TIGR02450 family Trp-rich protein [Colwellia sp. 12G3]